MKRILVIICTIFSVYAFGQGSPTGAKTQFKNGVALGSKDSTGFLTNDSLFLTIDRNNKFMWRNNGASGGWNVAARLNDTLVDTRWVRLQTGAAAFQQVGKMWVSDTIRTAGVVLANSVWGLSSTTAAGIVGNNSSTGRGGSFLSQSGAAVYAQNTSSTNPTTTIIQNGSARILDLLNGFGYGIKIDTSADISISNLRSADFTGKIILPTISANREYTLPNASGTIALTSNVTDSASALRASINTKLNISDTASMLAGVSLDRVLANGNTSGRAATVGAFNATTGYFSSDLTSAARMRSDKAFFNTSATGATDTVVSVVSAASGPAMVVNNTNGQALRVETVNAIGLAAKSTGGLGQAITAEATGGGEIFVASNGSTRVFEIKNSGKTLLQDSLVIDKNNRSLFGKNAANSAVIQLIGTNASDQINIASGGNQVNIGGALSGTSGTFSGILEANGGLQATTGSFNNTITSLIGNNSTVLNAASATTGFQIAINQQNTSGRFQLGLEGSTPGTLATGNTAYSTNILTVGNTDIALSPNQFVAMLLKGSNGSILALPTYSTTVGATNRDLFIDDTGLFGYVSSIRASKKNILPLLRPNWIHNLDPVSFHYRRKDSTGKYTDLAYRELEYGLIAEDVEKVNPEMVFYDVDATGKHLRGVSYSKLIIPMLKEIQEQKKTITALEARLAKLEAILNVQTKKQ